MLDDFMIRASLGGIGVALAAAPLGCFIVWRRMAYFGEATAHAALLGIALSLTFEFSVFLGAILVALIMASLVTLYEGRSLFLDTLLGVAGHSAIAAGLVIVSFILNCDNSSTVLSLLLLIDFIFSAKGLKIKFAKTAP